ncbi:glycoside hydrolase family 12 protein [Hebeloma cylindrosporum]|uniref:Glycoside hydrolase family 12 protein n=1 Tax=Hebeloma cylindrosporum TaxID=76867 RepID=A0A0C3CS89_HEBCY|nr:glycoside hydrolase family 12 protein [Hebeloma cylindrosporum h7]
MSAAMGGYQTSQLTAVNGDTISWQTTYNWAGAPLDVKSYANLNLRVGINQPLASIASIPAAWDWTYSSASYDLIADVSFDLWLSDFAYTAGATSSSTFEIMIWLSARGGAGPAGYQIDETSINGVTWKLFKGTVSTWIVFSFVASMEITSFDQDLMPFFIYLINKQNIPSSQFLVQAQAGTEPFIGSATLTTTSYSMAIY